MLHPISPFFHYSEEKKFGKKNVEKGVSFSNNDSNHLNILVCISLFVLLSHLSYASTNNMDRSKDMHVVLQSIHSKAKTSIIWRYQLLTVTYLIVSEILSTKRGIIWSKLFLELPALVTHTLLIVNMSFKLIS